MIAFATLLERLIRFGTVHVIEAEGTTRTLALTPEPDVTIRLTRRFPRVGLALYPSYFLPRAYVDGSLIIEKGSLGDFLRIVIASQGEGGHSSLLERLRPAFEPVFDALGRVGAIGRAMRDVRFHYDLSNAFFESFLDPNMQYSCAYFDPWTTDLATAQQLKMAHIAAKLDLRAGMSVLDIGCGWGGLAAYLARRCGGRVAGLTLSQRQAEWACEHWREPHLRFLLEDYRRHAGRYDRIVSVGMLEHVGRWRYDEYFAGVAALMKENGAALIHTIGRRGPPTSINAWLRRHIFPGTYLPSLSQLAAAIERQGLWLVDCENIRHHYARTLQCWRLALEKRQREITAERGAAFYRAWMFYLTSCELAFLHQGLTVYQMLLTRSADALPLTRDFIARNEAMLHHGLQSDEEARSGNISRFKR